MESTQLQNVPARDSSVEGMIMHAIDKAVPIETMERLLAMRRELRTEQAKEAFDRDMSVLQGELPVIKKTKKVYQKGTTEAQKANGTAIVRYQYAPIDAIVEQAKKYISDRGFSYSITTEQSEVQGEIKAICTVKHKDGHSEVSTFRVPIDQEAYMTAPQKAAAALTFAKRYAFCNAFGIMTGDEDNDANEVEDDVQTPKVSPAVTKVVNKSVQHMPGRITNEQKERLLELGKDLNIQFNDINSFAKTRYGIGVDGITEAQANAYIKVLEERLKAPAKVAVEVVGESDAARAMREGMERTRKIVEAEKAKQKEDTEEEKALRAYEEAQAKENSDNPLL